MILLSRGVQPDVMEAMTCNQLEFWKNVAIDLSKAEAQAAKERNGNR
jgi:hypothetical protein